MNILDSQINQYLSDHLPDRDPILLEMEQLAKERKFPVVGPLVGQLCFLIAKAISARRILELGSGFGYSAFWLAKALPEHGKIFCTELSADNIIIAKDFFQRGGLSLKVEFYRGDALELIQQFEGPFDIILNDVDNALIIRNLNIKR